jgi:sarcosine oxidase gamma subunit
LPREEAGQRVYRLWVDYSLAPYLWKTLAEIAAGLRV